MQPISFSRPLKKKPKKKDQIGGEPEETKTKMDIYRELAATYYLPDWRSRGCTKAYLRGVKNNICYRVERVKILQYLIMDKQKDRELKYQWRTDVEYPRMENYWHTLGRNKLGFDLTRGYPNEKWLMEILRYEDPANLQGIYVSPGPQRHDMILGQNTIYRRNNKIDHVNKMLYTEQMRQKSGWKSVYIESRNKQKHVISQKAHIEQLERDLVKAKKDLRNLECERNNLEDQLLNMVNGNKCIKVDMRIVSDMTNNTHERKEMSDFCFG